MMERTSVAKSFKVEIGALAAGASGLVVALGAVMMLGSVLKAQITQKKAAKTEVLA
ncbi:MAG: hypothetical protein ACLSDQ_04385 [Adlercreutzia equolifaciens]